MQKEDGFIIGRLIEAFLYLNFQYPKANENRRLKHSLCRQEKERAESVRQTVGKGQSYLGSEDVTFFQDLEESKIFRCNNNMICQAAFYWNGVERYAEK